MKKYLPLLFIIVVIMWGYPVKSQLIPQWATKLYFEDAAGNKDTLIVAHDSLATSQADVLFGEVVDTNRLFTNFKVQAVDLFRLFQTGSVFYSDKIVLFNEPLFINQPGNIACYLAGGAGLFFREAQMPITIRWHESDFSKDLCSGASFLIANFSYQLIEPWYYWPFNNPTYQCMSPDSSFTISLGKEFVDQNSGDPILTIIDKPDGGLDTLYGLILQFAYGSQNIIDYSGCPDFAVSTNEESPSDLIQFTLFPNPSSSKITISRQTNQSNFIYQLRVFHYNGSLVSKSKIDLTTPFQIDMEAWPSGLYYFELIDKYGNIDILKALKQ